MRVAGVDDGLDGARKSGPDCCRRVWDLAATLARRARCFRVSILLQRSFCHSVRHARLDADVIGPGEGQAEAMEGCTARAWTRNEWRLSLKRCL